MNQYHEGQTVQGRNFGHSTYEIWNDCIGKIIKICCYDDIIVEFDKPCLAGHDGDGLGKDGYCRRFWKGNKDDKALFQDLQNIEIFDIRKILEILNI